MIPTPVVLCIPVFAFCILLLFYPLSRVNFLLCFSFFISLHPVISPSNRKIQSHFRQHASPSFLDVTKVADITLRVAPGWKRRKRRGCNVLFDVWMRFFIRFSIRVCFFYIQGCDEMEVSAHLWPPLPRVSCWADFSPRASHVLQNLKTNFFGPKKVVLIKNYLLDAYLCHIYLLSYFMWFHALRTSLSTQISKHSDVKLIVHLCRHIYNVNYV